MINLVRRCGHALRGGGIHSKERGSMLVEDCNSTAAFGGGKATTSTI